MIEEEKRGRGGARFYDGRLLFLPISPGGISAVIIAAAATCFPSLSLPLAAAVVVVDSMSNVAWVDRPDRQKINFHINALKY